MAHPVAIVSPCLVKLIDYILNGHTVPTTLIVCATRESFLEDLKARLHSSDSASPHPLLVPTIHLLATTRTIRLAFTPTVGHLRAYLATFPSTTVTLTRPSRSQTIHPPNPRLFIIGLAALHRATIEYSAQGLSRSLAMAVEAASNTDAKLLLAEIANEEGEEGTNTGNCMGGDERQQDPWSELVPLLSGSIGLGGEDRIWSGRAIEIRRIVGRWCKFEALDVDDAGE